MGLTTGLLFPTPTDPLASVGPLIATRPDRRTYTHLTLTPMSPTIGAEVSGVRLTGELADEVLAEIRQALLDWKVLVFRDQDLTQDEHREFALRWGPLEEHPFFKFVQPGQEEADVVRLAKDAETGGVENQWHHDVTWRETPAMGAILRAVEVPEVGGDTLWADMDAAYELLPDDLKARVEHLQAEHTWLRAFGMGMAAEDRDRLAEVFPAVTHPVVRVHPETGRKSLFVNTVFTERILGVSQEESDELLRVLYRHVQRPELQVRLRWRNDTVAFWDNRACQHYAVSDYYPARRVMERISVDGDRPVGPAV